jgi:hypothetical protein
MGSTTWPARITFAASLVFAVSSSLYVFHFEKQDKLKMTQTRLDNEDKLRKRQQNIQDLEYQKKQRQILEESSRNE